MTKTINNQLRNILLENYKKYPQSNEVDFLKLIYQNEFGCGHLVSDPKKSLEMIKDELALIDYHSNDVLDYEYIGNHLCRLNLNVLNNSALSVETFNNFLISTANIQQLLYQIGDEDNYEHKVVELVQLCTNKLLPLSYDVVMQLFKQNKELGCPPFSHSQKYREIYQPHYRVVRKEFCDFLSLFVAIDNLLNKKEHVIVAIDGFCASGKSTLANLLKGIYDCNVFKMDDFFLQIHQRTAERLAELGGNVDYERFQQEVLSPLRLNQPFSYRPFDCSTFQFGKSIAAMPKRLSIIEGVYSMHPSLIDAYDLKVFLKVNPNQQKNRLMVRNPKMLSRFVEEWIPLEYKYFEHFNIEKLCDIVFDTSEGEI